MEYKIRHITTNSVRVKNAQRHYPDSGYYIVAPMNESLRNRDVYDLISINYAIFTLMGLLSVEHDVCLSFPTNGIIQYHVDVNRLNDYRYYTNKFDCDVIDIEYNTKKISLLADVADIDEYLNKIAEFISTIPCEPFRALAFSLPKNIRLTSDDMAELVMNSTDRKKVVSILKRAKIDEDVSAFAEAMDDVDVPYASLVMSYGSLLRGDHEAANKLKGKFKVCPAHKTYKTSWCSNIPIGSFGEVKRDKEKKSITGKLESYIIAFGSQDDAIEFVGLLYGDDKESITIHSYNDTIEDAIEVKSNKNNFKVHLSTVKNSTNLVTISFMSSMCPKTYSDEHVEIYLNTVEETIKTIFGKKEIPPIGICKSKRSYRNYYMNVMDSDSIREVTKDGVTIHFNTKCPAHTMPVQDHIIDFKNRHPTRNFMKSIFYSEDSFDVVVKLNLDDYTPHDLKMILNKMRITRTRINSVIIYPELEKKYPGLLYSKYL